MDQTANALSAHFQALSQKDLLIGAPLRIGPTLSNVQLYARCWGSSPFKSMSEPLITSAERAMLVAHLRKKTNDAALAEDLAQEALLRLFRVAETQRIRSRLALLYRIAANLAINELKAKKHRLPAAEDADVQDETPSAEKRMIDRERLSAAQRIIDGMPPKRREVLIRRRVNGESVADIAATMGLSKAAVEKHIVRGLAALNREFGRL